MEGIIHITGEHDVGKTMAALGVAHPGKTAFFHDDVKPPGIKDFGQFHDLVNDCHGMKLFQFREYVFSLLNKIKLGQFDSIVFDTWTRFGTSLRNYAVANSEQFREREAFVMRHNPKVLGAQGWQEAHRYEAETVGLLSSLVPCVVLVTHLKDETKHGGVKSGREIPDAGKSLSRVCNLRLWLRHNPNSGVPVALVLKRLSVTKISKNGLEVTNILPRRIKPLLDETSIWQSIERYKEVPFGNRSPSKDETPTPFELSILDGILTEDQKEAWRANLKEVRLVADGPEKAFAKEFLANGKDISPFELKAALRDAGHDLDMSKVSELYKELKNE